MKTHPFLSLVNSYVIDSPSPSNISYLWNYGSLLGLVLIIQIATGVTLAMHYVPHVDLAFISVEHIMRDVNYGWMIRYFHANGAAFFFIFIYIHMAKGLYYGSYKAPRVMLWSIGVIIFLLLIITGFLGYANSSLKWFNIFKFLSYDTHLSYDVLLSTFVPIKIYHNAETNRSKIYSDNLGKPGIYQWTHIESGKRYIGSSIDLTRRLRRYFSLMELKRVYNYICRAILSHTHSAFILTIYEYIDISHLEKKSSEVRKLILEREQFYIDSLSPEYNILKVAGSSLGVILSEETKEKMSKSKLGKNHHYFGKTRLAETKVKTSLTLLGRARSAEAKANISIAKGTSIFVYDLLGSLVNTFPSANEAAKNFKCSHHTILKYANNGLLFKEQWILSLSLISKK